MDANLICPRLERHQHVNTPDRGGCTAIIYKHAHRPFTSANKILFLLLLISYMGQWHGVHFCLHCINYNEKSYLHTIT